RAGRAHPRRPRRPRRPYAAQSRRRQGGRPMIASRAHRVNVARRIAVAGKPGCALTRAPKRNALGFTRVAVQMAWGILALALTALVRLTSANIMQAKRAQLLGAVVELARSKMYDVEALLLEDGFQETDQEDSGTFEDEGWPQVKWSFLVEKVEMPNIGEVQ